MGNYLLGREIQKTALASQMALPSGIKFTRITREIFDEFIRRANKTGNSFRADQKTVIALEKTLEDYAGFNAFKADANNEQCLRDGLGDAYEYLFSSVRD